MTGKLFGIQFAVSFWFFAVLFFFVWVGRELFLFYMLLPVIVHEFGHIAVIAARGGIRGIDLRPFGIGIIPTRDCFGLGEEFVIHSAGILVNLLFAAGLYVFCYQTVRIRLLVAVNLAVALFNLLPIGDLDGGRLMRLAVHRWLSPDTAYIVSRLASFLALTPLFAVSVFLLLGEGRNVTLLITCLYLALTVIFHSGD